MLTSVEHDEFRRAGLLRLTGAFPASVAEAMRERLWEFLGERQGIDREERATWTVESPTGLQAVTHSGAFREVGGAGLCDALDGLFGVGRWVRPRWWGRPLVTFPGTGAWEVPARGWHFDFMPASAEPRPVQYFAFLGRVRPGGGGPLALAGSHRLVARYLGRGDGFRMGRVRTSLAADPWLRGLWDPGGGGDRVRRYLDNETVVDGVPLCVRELTGEPGDIVLMHCDTFHASAPNRLAEPRMMLTEMVSPGREEHDEQ